MIDLLINVLTKPLLSALGSNSRIWVQRQSCSNSVSNCIIPTLHHVFSHQFNSTKICAKFKELG